MALATAVFVGDGTNRLFTLPFGYINKGDVTLTVDGNANGFEWQTDGSVQVNGTPGDDIPVVFTRVTDIDQPDITYIDGANLTDDQLNLGINQVLFGLQELTDKVDGWIETVQSGTIVGGDLPVVPAGNGNTFLVNDNAGDWVVKTLSEFQTILGLDDLLAGGTNELPDDPGFPGVLTVTTDGDLKWEGLKGTRDLLNLGNLALHESSDYPIIERTVGTDVGNVVALEDVDGNAGLPAIDGSQLTGLGKALYIRVDERAAFDADGGDYLVANTWVQRSLASAITDETSETSLTSGHLNVKAATYHARIQTKMRVTGFCNVRLVTESGATIYTGMGQTSGGEEVALEIGGPFTLNADDGLRVEVLSTGTWTDVRAKGTAHGQSGLGPNIYTTLELWKQP